MVKENTRLYFSRHHWDIYIFKVFFRESTHGHDTRARGGGADQQYFDGLIDRTEQQLVGMMIYTAQFDDIHLKKNGRLTIFLRDSSVAFDYGTEQEANRLPGVWRFVRSGRSCSRHLGSNKRSPQGASVFT